VVAKSLSMSASLCCRLYVLQSIPVVLIDEALFYHSTGAYGAGSFFLL
jgi:hypothetical protein